MRDGTHAVIPRKKHNITVRWPGYETIYETIEVSEEMPESERIFSYKLRKRKIDKQEFNSGYVGGIKLDYEPNPPKLGEQGFGNNFGLAVSLDIPLPVPLFSLTAYGGGGLATLKSQSTQSSETDISFFSNAGAGLLINLTKNETGIYAKGIRTYRAVSLDPFGDGVSTSYSSGGYAVGGGFQYTPKRNSSLRFEIMYNFLEFDHVKISGIPRKLEQKIDASSLTFSCYLLIRYNQFY